MEDKATNVDEILAKAKSEGNDDPVVECHTHGFKATYSQLSPIAAMALHEGLDTTEDRECLLASK